jgi:cardiolipin synthase
MTEQRVLTVPNVLSVVRLLCTPVFVWLLLVTDDEVAALALLGVLAATDWVDGGIARRYDQGSELGKVLDPVADRVLLLVAAIALMVDGVVPLWVGIAVLVRELIVSLATLALATAGAARIDVQWVGKAGTFFVMFALPGFLLVDILEPGTVRDVFEVLTWAVTIVGLVLSYYAAARYVPLARDALRSGRAARAHGATEMARP